MLLLPHAWTVVMRFLTCVEPKICGRLRTVQNATAAATAAAARLLKHSRSTSRLFLNLLPLF